MQYIDKQLKIFKNMIEQSIIVGGVKGKESMIRSSQLINLIHDAVKYELLNYGVSAEQIYPPCGQSRPEIKLAGFLKQKDQDVCVIPKNIDRKPMTIDWGPMEFQRKLDPFGFNYSNQTLVINIRSQMSSLAKNSDTLFERTFAESLNLHMRYPEIVLGEVYLIPVNEYDDEAVKNNIVSFKNNYTDVKKYISFFNSINNRNLGQEDYKYERCSLLIVDFSQEQPILFRSSQQLKDANIIPKDFEIEYSSLGFDNFVPDLLNIYNQRFDLKNLIK